MPIFCDSARVCLLSLVTAYNMYEFSSMWRGGGPSDYVFLLSEGELCNVGESRFEPDNLWRTQIGLVPFT